MNRPESLKNLGTGENIGKERLFKQDFSSSKEDDKMAKIRYK